MIMINFLLEYIFFADLGVGEFLPLDVNHVDVCKPSSQSDERYVRTAQFIKELISK